LRVSGDLHDCAIVTHGKSCSLMITHSEDSFSNHKPDSSRLRTLPQTLWLRVIELWLFTVLAAFFLVRILGSETVRHILSRIPPLHAR
jgi:hypothetical protein